MSIRSKMPLRDLVIGVVVSINLMSSAYAAADASSSSVIIESGGVTITALDLEAELRRAPPDVRNGLLFRKESLAQLASNLLVRRVLAKQAALDGVEKMPLNQAALELARDRVLSDIQLDRMSQLNKPSDALLELRAKDVYLADSKRFEISEEVEVSHILVLAETEGAVSKANSILEELKSGKPFSDMAKTHSQDPGSATKGGELGFFGRGKMVKEFEDAAFAMKIGELSGVIKTQFGYHILKVTGRKEPEKQPFSQVRDTLMNEANQKILAENRVRFVESVLGGAKTFPDNLDAFVTSQGTK